MVNVGVRALSTSSTTNYDLLGIEDRVRAVLEAAGLSAASDRNVVTDEEAERNRTVREGGYTFHAPVEPGTFGPVIVFACVRLGDHAHIDIDTSVAVPTPFSDHNPELRRGSAGHLIMAWPDWILFRSILANSPIVHIAEVENPTRGQIGFHTRDDREAQIVRLLEQHPEMEVWFR